MSTITGTPGSAYSPRAKRVVGIATPKAQKVDSDCCVSSGDVRDQEIIKLNADVQNLKGILQKAKVERETLLGTISHLEQQASVQESVVQELQQGRSYERASFKRNIENTRLAMENKADALRSQLAAREQLLLLWVEYGTAAIIETPTSSIRPLLVKTCNQIPAAKEKTASIYEHYVKTVADVVAVKLNAEKEGSSNNSGTPSSPNDPKELIANANVACLCLEEILHPYKKTNDSENDKSLSKKVKGNSFEKNGKNALKKKEDNKKNLNVEEDPEASKGNENVEMSENDSTCAPKSATSDNDTKRKEVLSRGMTAALRRIHDEIDGVSDRIGEYLDGTQDPFADDDEIEAVNISKKKTKKKPKKKIKARKTIDKDILTPLKSNQENKLEKLHHKQNAYVSDIENDVDTSLSESEYASDSARLSYARRRDDTSMAHHASHPNKSNMPNEFWWEHMSSPSNTNIDHVVTDNRVLDGDIGNMSVFSDQEINQLLNDLRVQ